jgi:hypothetical protein
MSKDLHSMYDYIMSIGSNCSCKFYIDKFIKPPQKETKLFDYVGTSMWGINLLLKNKFEGLTDSTHFSALKIFHSDATNIITHTKYYMRFLHDANNISDIKSTHFISKIQRRIDRFEQAMRTSKRILFFRLQETLTTRIIYTPPVHSELDELNRCIPLLKSLYGCPSVTGVYINTDYDGWNADGTILYVKIESLDIPWQTRHIVIAELFAKNHVLDELMKLDPLDLAVKGR